MPAVSIVIPTKNRGGLLMQTLASVRAQTFGDWEAIVVDDHSTDDTLVRLQQACLDDPRIRYLTVQKPHHGAQAARNAGIADSGGRYVMLLDSDDLLADFCLAQRVPVLDADASLAFAIFPCECFRFQPGDVAKLWNVPTDEADLDRFLKLDVPWQTSSPLWRREAITALLPWPEDVPIAQDWEFHIRALLANPKYVRAGRPDHFWRQAESERDSIGNNTMRPEMLSARVRVNERLVATVAAARRLDAKAKEVFAGLFFQSAERIADRFSRREGAAVWARAKAAGLITDKQLGQGRLYFKLFRFKRLKAAYRRRLERRWPAAFFAKRSTTYLKADVAPADAITLPPPAVSVVMSVYNAERYLREAVDSILAQTFTDFEFIIVDDGSKDGSLAILQDARRRDPRVRLISRANRGLTVSLNEALAAARAPRVARMDADDVALPTRLAEQVNFLEANADVVVVGAAVELVDPFGVHIGDLNVPEDHAAIDARLLKGEGGVIVHPASMFRTDAVRRVGNYREQFNNSEDLDLWLRLAEVGRVANLPKILLKYRRDPGSVSHTKRDNQLRIKRTILAEAYARRGMTPPEQWSFGGWMPKPPAEQIREWGWKALSVGRIDAARGHAKALLKLKPRSIESWRLAYCAWRGR